MFTNEFLAAEVFAVVGASNDRSKFGNRVLRHYAANDRTPVPVNPHAAEIEGYPAFPTLSAAVRAHPGLDRASIITPSAVTAEVVDEAIALGSIRYLWMQPGAEDGPAIARARAAGIEVVAGGACVLVSL